MAVVVRHGANQVLGEYVGFTIEQTRRAVAEDTAVATELNIPSDKATTAVVFLNGVEASEAQEKEYRLRDGDKLEFSKEMTKSILVSVH